MDRDSTVAVGTVEGQENEKSLWVAVWENFSKKANQYNCKEIGLLHIVCHCMGTTHLLWLAIQSLPLLVDSQTIMSSSKKLAQPQPSFGSLIMSAIVSRHKCVV